MIKLRKIHIRYHKEICTNIRSNLCRKNYVNNSCIFKIIIYLYLFILIDIGQIKNFSVHTLHTHLTPFTPLPLHTSRITHITPFTLCVKVKKICFIFIYTLYNDVLSIFYFFGQGGGP